ASERERLHRLPNRVRAAREARAFIFGELHLDDILQSAATELAGYAEKNPRDSVLTFQPRGARKYAALVQDDRFHHLHRASRGRVVSRSGLQVLDDLGSAATSTGNYGIELRALQQLRNRNPAHG